MLLFEDVYVADGTDAAAFTALLDRAVEVARQCADLAAATDAAGSFPEREFQLIADAGLLVAPLRREYGGLGLGIAPHTTLPLLHLLKHIGRGNLAVGRIYEGHVNALQLVQLYGTAQQIERYAADAQAGHIFGVWNAEAADGVTVLPLGDDRYRLEGPKPLLPVRATSPAHLSTVPCPMMVVGRCASCRWNRCKRASTSRGGNRWGCARRSAIGSISAA